MRGWTIPRLVETKHIKHRLLRVGNGALFCSLKYISSAFRFCAGGLFFLPSGRLVRRLFSFHFPVAGWLRELNKNPKRSQTWPTEIRIPASAKVSIPELCTTPSPRARVREESADFTAWRVKTFGGNFDPVREAVEDAIAEFSDRQAARDRSLWLKIANKIGYEAFRDLENQGPSKSKIS